MYQILLLPILAGFITQVIKFLIKSNQQKFNFKNLLAYSGMPSGHSALIISLAAPHILSKKSPATLTAIHI